MPEFNRSAVLFQSLGFKIPPHTPEVFGVSEGLPDSINTLSLQSPKVVLSCASR